MALTEKQEAFCRNIISGMNGKESYIAAYNSKGSDQNAYNEASKLLARDDIQERLKVLRKPLEEVAVTKALTEREKKKAIIWDRINACIANNDDSAVARYMDILNKMDAEYININKNINDNDDNITELDTDKLIRLVTTA